MEPSMEKTPSVQMIFRLASLAPRSLSRRSSMSLCLYTPVVHFVMDLARRTESMMDAWLSASETTKSPSRAMVGVSASLAFQAETKESDASVPTKRASAVSRSRCRVKVPQIKRTEAVPAP